MYRIVVGGAAALVALAAVGAFLRLDAYAGASHAIAVAVDQALLGVEAAATPAPTRAYVAAINLLTLVECAIALLLIVRAAHRPDIRALGLLFVCLAIAEGESFYPLLALGVGELPLSRAVFAASVLALAALLRFSALFPVHLTREHLIEGAARPHRSLRSALGLPLRKSGAAPAAPPQAVAVRPLGRWARWTLDPRIVWGTAGLCAGLTLVSDAAGAWLLVSFVFLIPATLLRAARNLRIGYRLASPQQRRRVLWLVQGCLATLGLFVWGTMVLPILAVVLPDTQIVQLLAVVHWDRLVTPTLVAFMTVAVLYDGGADPALAIQKTAIYGPLGVLVAFLFAGLENVATDWVTQGLGLPAAAGTWVAGGFAALVVGSVKDRVEDVGGRYLEHVLPTDRLALAPARDAVIVSAGISADSGDDERLRLTRLSVLHRAAKRAAKQFRAASVTTLADFTILEFADSKHALLACAESASAFQAMAEALSLPPVSLGFGVHRGPLVVGEKGSLHGSAITGADALRRFAGPWEVRISTSVTDSISAPQAAVELPALQHGPVIAGADAPPHRCWSLDPTHAPA